MVEDTASIDALTTQEISMLIQIAQKTYGSGGSQMVKSADLRTDQALRWLDCAVTRGFVNDPLIAELDPFLESVRRDPRFAWLRRSVKAKWEQAANG
jgi:hypothetical protein